LKGFLAFVGRGGIYQRPYIRCRAQHPNAPAHVVVLQPAIDIIDGSAVFGGEPLGFSFWLVKRV